MYSIKLAAPGDPALAWFDTPDEAMTAVNRLRASRIEGFVIRDTSGAILTDRQLAMIVMERRLTAARV